MIEACGAREAPRYLIHDRDASYGSQFNRRVRSLGIRQIRTPVKAPKANAIAERWIRTVRAGCLDHVCVFGHRHLQPLNVVRPATGLSQLFGRPSSLRIAKGSLSPLATMKKHYPIDLPDCPGRYTVDVRLNFRHMPPALMDHVGVPHLKHLLEIVELEHFQSVLHVGL